MNNFSHDSTIYRTKCMWKIISKFRFFPRTFHNYNYNYTQVRFYTLRRMALAFALTKQMLKLENRSKDARDFGRDLWIASLAATCDRKNDAVQIFVGIFPSKQSPTFVCFSPSCSFMAVSGPFHGLRPTHGVQ